MTASLARRLDEYLTAQASLPFDWETHNCCHFAGGWVQVAEGLDPMADLPLVSIRSMMRAVHEFGCLEQAVCFQLGRAPIAPAMAQLGDIVLMPTAAWGGAPGRHSVGICVGTSAALPDEQVAVFIAEDGACVYWPVLEAQCAWAVARAA